MEILAISGENLASLAGAFEVRLDQGLLHDAGLFCISGPTGSGKSTLLDCICLALYGKLPRMVGRKTSGEYGSGDATHTLIKDTDQRGIIHHGSGSARATVDFVGQNGQTYRASWQVKRAREKTDGKLQAAKLSLINLNTDEVIGDKQRDIQEAIERAIGLTFEQFCRTVLLAQGEFDAFLKADSEDRALLLQDLTGTDIYEILGIKAFEKERDFKDRIKAHDLQFSQINILEAADRTALEKAWTEAGKALSRLEETDKNLTAGITWFRGRDQLQSNKDRLVAGYETAERQLLDQQKELAPLLKLGAALNYLPLWQDYKSLDQQVSQIATQTERQRDQALHFRKNLPLAHTQEKHARKYLNDTQTEFDALLPALNEARIIDRSLQDNKTRLATSKQALDIAKVQKKTVHQAIDTNRALQDKLQNEHKDAQDFLLDHAAYLPLIPQKERILDLINGIGQVIENHSLAPDIPLQLPTIETLSSDQKAIEDSLSTQDARLSALLSLQEQLGEMSVTLDSAHPLKESIQSCALLDERVRQSIEEEKEAKDALREEEKQIEIAKKDLFTLSIRIDEAKLRIKAARDEAAALILRDTLMDEKPCPVCGSIDHPVRQSQSESERYIQELPLLSLSLEAEEKRVETLMKEDQKIRDRVSQSQTKSQLITASIEKNAQSRETTKAQGDDLKSQIDADLKIWVNQLDAAFDSIPPDLIETIEHAPIRAEDEPLQAINNRIARHRLIAQMVAQQIMSCRGEMAELTNRLKDLKQALELVDRLKTLHDMIHEAVPDAQALILQNCNAFFQKIDQTINALEAARTAEETYLQNRMMLKEDAIKLSNDMEHAETLRTQHETQSIALGEQIETEETQIKNLMGQSDIDAFERQWQRRIQMAQKACHDASSERDKIQTGYAQMRKEWFQNTCQKFKLRDLRHQIKLDIEQHLKQDQIQWREALPHFIDHGAHIKSAKKTVDALTQALTLAKTRRDDAQAALDQIKDSPVELKSLEDCQKALDDLRGPLAEQREVFEALSYQKTRDDEDRLHAADMIEARENLLKEADIWMRLSHLIGSADGKKFRNFAQGLTLSHLIGLANQHLKRLEPRYSLQKQPGQSLGLQVIDHDMGDEIRSTHNLSGGERFIASLALALGLGEMTGAQGHFISCLFIDEGFGTLDRNSLSQVLAMLEQIQSTGRKIGVISHVEDIKDRLGAGIAVIPLGNGKSTLEIFHQ